MAARKKVVRTVKDENYTALEIYAIAINEYYKALRKAGFSVELSLGILEIRSAYPDWLLPEIPNVIDPFEYDDEDED
jgi:hypothetical protein